VRVLQTQQRCGASHVPKVNFRDEGALTIRVCVIGTVYPAGRLIITLIKGNERRIALVTALTESQTRYLTSVTGPKILNRPLLGLDLDRRLRCSVHNVNIASGS
jgi:hypothetical protein